MDYTSVSALSPVLNDRRAAVSTISLTEVSGIGGNGLFTPQRAHHGADNRADHAAQNSPDALRDRAKHCATAGAAADGHACRQALNKAPDGAFHCIAQLRDELPATNRIHFNQR